MAESKSAKNRSRKDEQSRFLCENLSFAGKEAYKRLRTNLQFCFPEEETGCSVVGVTSSHPAEGKSITSINLAYSMAQLNKRVLLVDADMRRSSISEKLKLASRPGLSNLLLDSSTEGSIQPYEPEDGSFGFYFLAAGDTPPNPSELLNSSRLSRLIAGLRTRFDYIIFDLPPVGAVSDAQTVSTLVDGMLVVVRENHTTKPLLSDCIRQLKLTNTRILGFVINGAVEGASKTAGYSKYGSYSSYNSYYK